MKRISCIFAIVLAISSTVVSAQIQSQSSNPACQRLEAQLATLDRGNADPARAEQIRRAEDTVNRQQFEVDRLVAQARRMDCESSGFFSIFSNPPPQCGALMRQIDQQRFALERLRGQLEQLNGGTTERAAQRQSLLIALGDNGCGPQYRSAALAGQQGGFFDRLFGGNGSNIYSTPPGPMGGTFRTVCVRTCDGFYFPISYSTLPSRFADDARACQRLCPAAEAELYSFRNPGEDMEQAVSVSGQPYTALPNAFRYRKEIIAGCSCRRPGQSWADALKNADDSSTLESGDIVVTDQNAKALSQPKPSGKPGASMPQLGANSAAAGTASPTATTTTSTVAPDNGKRTVRTVGPPFLSSQSSSQSAPQSQ